jgi:acyl-CoA thioester hydrolase
MTPAPSATRPQPTPRSRYGAWRALPTRWMDNDVYGHLNNVVHYSLFDTAVNGWLLAQGVLDFRAGAVVGLVVHTHCDYFAELVFPQTVHAGLRLVRAGRSSVTYEIGLFADDTPLAAAVGQFVHVYVGRESRRPVDALPPPLCAALSGLPHDEAP